MQTECNRDVLPKRNNVIPISNDLEQSSKSSYIFRLRDNEFLVQENPINFEKRGSQGQWIDYKKPKLYFSNALTRNMFVNINVRFLMIS